MLHHGAIGSDARDGDGAGATTSIPQRKILGEFERDQGFELLALGQYATGNLFFKLYSTILKEIKTTHVLFLIVVIA
jgi:glutamate synthase (NADPH/NADH)